MFLERTMRKNMSTTLSNVRDTKIIDVFILKIRWEMIMNLMIRFRLVTVSTDNQNICKNLELNSCLSSVPSYVICGIAF